jgi:MFS family permease
MFGIGVVANFLILPLFAVVLPVYAKQTYGSAVNLGLMLGGFGGGALVGTVSYGTVGHLLPRRATLVSAIVVVGPPFWVLVATPSLVFTMVALFVAGFALGLPNQLTYSVLQERTPPQMLGWVLGAGVSLLSMVAVPMGMALCGIAGDLRLAPDACGHLRLLPGGWASVVPRPGPARAGQASRVADGAFAEGVIG